MNGKPLACLIRDEIAVSQIKLKSDTVRFQRHHESKSFQHLPVSFQNPSHVGLSEDKVLQNPGASSEVQNLIFSSLELQKTNGSYCIFCTFLYWDKPKKMPSTRQQLQPRVSTLTPRPWLRRVSRGTGAGQAQQRPEATQGEAQGEAHQPRNSSGGTWRQVQNLLNMKI